MTNEQLKQALKGKIIPAVPVPMTAEYRIHNVGHDRLVEYIASQDVGGVAVWAHTGRGLHLDFDARKEVMKRWRQGISGCIIAGVGGVPDPMLDFERRMQRFIADTLVMAEDAVSTGADAFLVYAPVIYRGHEEQDRLILEYHKRVAELDKPIVLFYLYEEAGGISYSAELLRELVAIPQVVGVKVATLDSIMTYQDICRMFARDFPDRVVITGEDRMLGYTIMRGAESALIGMGTTCTKLQVELLNAFGSGDYERFVDLSNRVDDFAQVTFAAPMEKYIIRLLWSLVAEGVIPEEAAHDMLGYTISKREIERIKTAVNQLKVEL